MRGNPVFPALPGSHPSILDFSLFLLSSAASWTSSLLQAVGGNHFVKIPLCIVWQSGSWHSRKILPPQSPMASTVLLRESGQSLPSAFHGPVEDPLTSPSLSPCTSGFYLLTGFYRGPSSRPFVDSMILASIFPVDSPEVCLLFCCLFACKPHVAHHLPLLNSYCLLSSHRVLFSQSTSLSLFLFTSITCFPFVKIWLDPNLPFYVWHDRGF